MKSIWNSSQSCLFPTEPLISYKCFTSISIPVCKTVSNKAPYKSFNFHPCLFLTGVLRSVSLQSPYLPVSNKAPQKCFNFHTCLFLTGVLRSVSLQFPFLSVSNRAPQKCFTSVFLPICFQQCSLEVFHFSIHTYLFPTGLLRLIPLILQSSDFSLHTYLFHSMQGEGKKEIFSPTHNYMQVRNLRYQR